MGEIFRKEIAGQTIYAIWEISETTEELRSMITLNEDETRLYGTFLAEERKKQWLAYRILIRSILEPEAYPVAYDSSGKPYLAGSGFHISVTHSRDLAAVIISRKGRVGIDIEKIRPRIARVREKFLDEQENALIADEDLETLTLGWCAKEALYKLYGEKNLDFRKNIRLSLPIHRGSSTFTGSVQKEGHVTVYELSYRVLRDFILVYVAE